MVLASAPGKLVICGEYAVLDGATALVSAVTQRASAQVALISADESTLEHPLTGAPLQFTASSGGVVTWRGSDPGDWGAVLAAAVASVCADERIDSLPSIAVRIDTSDFYAGVADNRIKLGLGSSAAATVALCRALIGVLDRRLGLDDLERICRAAHARLQQGRGSGIDVLAAIHGGVIAATGGATCRPVPWPDGFIVVPVWSGTPASSVELVGRFDAYRARREADSARHLERLRELAAQAVTAWCAADTGLILAALGEYDAALVRLDRDAGIGIYTGDHDRLRDIAIRAGAGYKVSGAGGGDFGLAFTDSATAGSAAREAFTKAGFVVLNTDLAAPGVAFAHD
jgi:phosphomevalonate kinase